MTTLKCGKHQSHYNTEFYSTCPICDAHALHPDPESAVAELRDSLGELFPRRWADAIENDDHAQQLSDIAKKAHELRLEIDALCTAIDWPEDRKVHAVTSHNEERISA